LETTPVSVVSGGSSGMGLAIATRFARDGGRVAVLGRSERRLVRAAAQLTEAGAAEVLTIEADATSEDQVSAAFSQIGEQWAFVNALVNAVGPSSAGSFDDLDDDAWRGAFEEGVLTAVHCTRHALPLLRAAPWARIVNLTAMSTKHQSPNLIAYTAAKAALASLTKNLARTFASHGILVNAVAPGAVLTGTIAAAVRHAGGDDTDPQDAYRVMSEKYGTSTDVQRVGLPAEVAEVVAFCCSQANGYMTGAHINVDGGSDFC
jgi:NAD(P)-dependent dehydrogenase (short-subunit alcohol dehydrogenase family)